MSAAEFNPSKLRILRSAVELFHKKGVQATSVDDVLKHSEAGKGQFYYYFKSKDSLIREVLKFYGVYICERLPDRFQSLDEFGEWLRDFVRQQAEFECQRACPIGSIGVEMSNNDLIRQDVQMLFLRIRNALVVFFSRLKDRNEIAGEPAILANLVLSVLQGGLLLGKIDRETRPLEDSINSTLDYLRSLRP